MFVSKGDVYFKYLNEMPMSVIYHLAKYRQQVNLIVPTSYNKVYLICNILLEIVYTFTLIYALLYKNSK